MISKDVRIIGLGHPVDDLKGRNDNGFSFLGPKSAGAEVSGFVVKGATFEGIVAKQTSHITIADNVVEGNDRGATAQHPTGECVPQGEVPGDCGEGIHLYGGVNHSTVTRNTVTRNTGGIHPGARDLAACATEEHQRGGLIITRPAPSHDHQSNNQNHR